MENNENMSNQVIENNNNQKEKKNNNKTIGIVILIIGLLLLGLAGYKLFIEKPETDKPKDDNTQEKEKNNNTSDDKLFIEKPETDKPKDDNTQAKEKNNNTSKENVYKTKDGNFTLKLVQKNDSKAIEKAKKFGEDTINEAKLYAYFNDTLLVVTDIYNEDDHYATFGFSGYENAEANGYSLVINKDTNTLEINPTNLASKDKNCMKENFCGFPHHMSFIKSDLGYFFIDESYGDNVLYTTSWKKLGYVYKEKDKLKEVDSTGVTVYRDRNVKECDGNECGWELLNPTKYDINGNVVKQTSNGKKTDATISSENIITELAQYELNSSNRVFNFSNATIKLKKVEDKLYINDSVATIQDYSGEFVEINPSVIYKTNKFIIISVEWQGTEYPYAINEKGELINIKRMTADTGQDYIHDLKLENNKVVATQSGDGPGSVDKKVEFEYKINEMSIKYAK